MLFCIPFGFWIGRGSGPLLPGLTRRALSGRCCGGYAAAPPAGRASAPAAPTLVYDSCFESGGYEKTPAGNTQREAF